MPVTKMNLKEAGYSEFKAGVDDSDYFFQKTFKDSKGNIKYFIDALGYSLIPGRNLNFVFTAHFYKGGENFVVKYYDGISIASAEQFLEDVWVRMECDLNPLNM